MATYFAYVEKQISRNGERVFYVLELSLRDLMTRDNLAPKKIHDSFDTFQTEMNGLKSRNRIITHRLPFLTRSIAIYQEKDKVDGIEHVIDFIAKKVPLEKYQP